MKAVFSFILVIFTAFSTLAADFVAEYDIILFGKSIGKGIVKKTVKADGTVHYHLYTSAKAKVMMKDRTSMSDVNLFFKNNMLQNGTLKREKDGEYQNVAFKYTGSNYQINNDGKTLEESKPIRFTTTSFFFEEPKNIKEAYVERLQTFVPIVKESEGVYSTKVDGGTNYYTYKDGKLVEFKTKQGISIYMNLLEK